VTGVWSVDAIQALPSDHLLGLAEPHLVRLVHYKPETDAPVGIRQLLVPGELVPNGEQQAHLGFGKAFQPSWSRLRDPEHRLFFLTPENLDDFPERTDIEETLKTSIESALGESAETEGRAFLDRSKDCLEIHVMNVGQGDTILIKLPNGAFWLIDAFSWNYKRWLHVEQFLRHCGCSKLEKLVISHFHYDHIRNACDVIRSFQPDEVIVPNHVHATSAARNLVALAGARLKRLANPTTYTYGSHSLCLAPTAPPPFVKDPNEHAIVLHISSPFGTALLSGDVPGNSLYRLAQKMMWSFGGFQSIYKVTHHCSATGNDPNLFKLLQPTDAATSCAAKNRYGHPELNTQNLIDGLVYPGKHLLTFKHRYPITYWL